MTDLALFILPIVLLAVAGVLLLPAPLLAEHRKRAGIVALALVLATSLLHGAMLQSSPLAICMALITALVVAAPLLERARFFGLTVAALATGLAVDRLFFLLPGVLPDTPSLSMLPVALVMALVVGMAGGMKLPLQPRRQTVAGEAIWHGAPQGIMLAGWACMALALAALALMADDSSFTIPQLAGSLTAALVALLHAEAGHGDDAWQKAGEGLVAGMLITLLVPLSPIAGIALGMVAGLCVVRSEAIAHALRMDDPHHFTGALLLPAMLGLLMPGLHQTAQLAAQLQWLGAAIGCALALSIIIWPAAMLLFGIALPPRLVREGVR